MKLPVETVRSDTHRGGSLRGPLTQLRLALLRSLISLAGAIGNGRVAATRPLDRHGDL